MSTKFKRLSSALLAMVMIFSLFSTNVAQAASIDIGSENESMDLRTKLTFLEGVPGDNHLVYTYRENGQQYKVVEDADADFINVYSTIYVMNSEGNYVETKSQVLNVQPGGNCRLTSTDMHGNWVTQTRDGSSYIYNMTVSAIGAVIGAALGGKIGAAIGYCIRVFQGKNQSVDSILVYLSHIKGAVGK